MTTRFTNADLIAENRELRAENQRLQNELSALRQSLDLGRMPEQAILHQNAILIGVNHILNAALTSSTENELGIACLDVAEKITQSQFGIIGEINGQSIEVIAISKKAMLESGMAREGRNTHGKGRFPISNFFECLLNTGKSLIVNDPALRSLHIQFPEGHPPVDSVLGVPLYQRGRIIGVVAVANRPQGYDSAQQKSLETVASAIVEAFERKRAEAAIRESEERFRILFEEHCAMMLLIDPVTATIVDANQSAADFYGYSRAELRSMKIERINQLPREQIAAECQNALASLKACFVFPHRLANGETRWVEVDSSPVVIKGRSLLFSIIHDITERKHMEEVLQAEHRKLEAVFENLHAGIMIADANGNLLSMNAAALKMHGFDSLPANIRPENFAARFEMRHPNGQLALPHERPSAFGFRGEVCVDKEFQVRDRVTGREWTGCWSVAPVRNTQNQSQFMVYTVQDITEKKRSEEALHKLNRSLRALSNSNQALMRAREEKPYLDEVARIVVEDCGYAMVWIGFVENDESKSIRPVAFAGFDQGYVDGLNLTWGDTERGQGPTGLAIRTGKPVGCRNIDTDPQFEPWREEALKRGYASSMAVPLLDQGRVIGVISIYSREPDPFTEVELQLLVELADDVVNGISTIRARISEKQAQDALRHSEEKFALAFSQNPAAIAITRLQDGLIFEVNDTWTELLGYTREEVLGRSARALPVWEAKASSQFVQELQTKGSLKGWEMEFRKKSGELFVGQVSSQVLSVRGEKMILTTVVDITSRKRAERLLQSQAEHLESLVQERTQKLQAAISDLEHFSYCITHDLRAPLRALQSYGELLKTENCINPENKPGVAYLERMVSAAARMDALVVDALDYGKIARGEVQLAKVMVDVLLRDLLLSYPNLQPDLVEILLEGEFPPVLAHAAGLTQCFSNLLGNAVKFVSPGTKPTVRVWAEIADNPMEGGVVEGLRGRSGKWVRIWFQDNGIGIPAGCEKRIFEMFQRVSTDHQGTGIGLAIVKKSIERMGGNVGVKSEAGNGSSFWLELRPAS